MSASTTFPTRFFCPCCNELFRYYFSFDRHIETEHKNCTEETLCDYCIAHICPCCNKKFTYIFERDSHYKQNHPFCTVISFCIHCDKPFVNKDISILKAHEKWHEEA